MIRAEFQKNSALIYIHTIAISQQITVDHTLTNRLLHKNQ